MFTKSHTSLLNEKIIPISISQPKWSFKDLSIALSALLSKRDHHKQISKYKHDQKNGELTNFQF